LRAAGCEVHARSAFLQGLLLMPPAARPSWTTRFGPVWHVWDEWLGEQGITATEACLRFVRSAPGVDFAVVGVDNADQLAELIAIGSKPLPVRPEWPAMPAPRNLITPSLWPRT
jgi:aryl-alcohol dehydrogenase-like predicted oxidoreductase